MTVQLIQNIKITDELRRAVAYQIDGREGRRATVAEVRDYLTEAYRSLTSDLVHDFRNVQFNRRLNEFVGHEIATS
jgi:hypothetical protein